MVLKIIFPTLFIIFFVENNNAQTCCSGGVPMSSNLGLPIVEKNTLQFRISYDLNNLQTLKSGREKLNDNSRTRKTHSGLLEIGYQISKKISADFFLSYVKQERKINQFGNENITTTNGVGDATILFKLNLISNKDKSNSFSSGLGIKAPLGNSDFRRDDRLPIVADLQPGSGSWDFIFWNQFNQQLNIRPTMSLNLSGNYAFKGKNNNYLGSQSYQFGNELLLAIGLSDRLLINDQIIDPSFELRFRASEKDKINGNGFPSTSGKWIFITPGINYWMNPNFSFNANFTLPVFAEIEGTQVSPTWRFNGGIYFII